MSSLLHWSTRFTNAFRFCSFGQLKLATRLCVTAALFVWGLPAGAKSAADIYKSMCAGCHGDRLEGGMGSALNDGQWQHGSTPDAIAKNIRNGIGSEMPAFGATLDDADIRALVIFIQETSYYAKQDSQGLDLSQPITAAGHTFKIVPVVQNMENLWGMDFLPNGDLIFTSKKGELFLYQKGKVQGPVQGIPKVRSASQAGLLDVKAHPEYKKNGWIYLTFADDAEDGTMTRVVRGKIKKMQWSAQEDIFKADDKFYSNSNGHFGSRLAFRDGYVFFSIGDRRNQAGVQSLDQPNGKIHRFFDDGRIPKDNPFVDSAGALKSIYSYGHRNPQGLTIHPVTGALWSAEHGPRGGDEINLVKPGKNYGWPVITYGMNYNGTPITEKTSMPGMEQPDWYWVPSIAVSQIDFYRGKLFPKWQDKLLVASLKKQELHLLTIENDKVIEDTILFKGVGRMRDINVNAQGEPHLIAIGDQGGIYKLVPVPKK